MGLLDDAIREHLELKRRHGADSQEVSRQEREILGAASGADVPGAGYDEPADVAAAVDFVDPVEAAPAAPVEPLAGSPLAEPEPAPAPEVPQAAPGSLGGDIFPGTHELLAAASETPPAPPAPATPAGAGTSALRPPAPADADSETAARSGARRLSDDELAAWRRRLSERADRLAAQRPGTGSPATPAGASASPTPPSAPAQSEPPAYWSGNTSSADAGTPPASPLDKPATAAAAAAPTPPAVEPTAPGVPADFFDAGDAEDAFAPEAAPEPVAETPDHDVLDDTPDFLEETPEHDRMWFEQKPPRDFDFG